MHPFLNIEINCKTLNMQQKKRKHKKDINNETNPKLKKKMRRIRTLAGNSSLWLQKEGL